MAAASGARHVQHGSQLHLYHLNHPPLPQQGNTKNTSGFALPGSRSVPSVWLTSFMEQPTLGLPLSSSFMDTTFTHTSSPSAATSCSAFTLTSSGSSLLQQQQQEGDSASPPSSAQHRLTQPAQYSTACTAAQGRGGTWPSLGSAIAHVKIDCDTDRSVNSTFVAYARSLLGRVVEGAVSNEVDRHAGDHVVDGGGSPAQVEGLPPDLQGSKSRMTEDQACSCPPVSTWLEALATTVRPVCKQEVRRRGRAGDLKLAWKLYVRNARQRRVLWPPEAPGGRARALGDRQFFMSVYGTPLYPCFGEERVGAWGEGGKWVCRPFDLGPDSVVYSVGSQGESSFEADLFALTGAVSHTFDPTLTAGQITDMRARPHLKFHDLGFTGRDESGGVRQVGGLPLPWGGLPEGARVRRVGAVMRALGHAYVDVLKIDCELCELGVLADVLQQQREREREREQQGEGEGRGGVSPLRPLFGQILVEFHSMASARMMVAILRVMEDLGYLLFHAEQNWLCSECMEMAYIHRSLARPRRQGRPADGAHAPASTRTHTHTHTGSDERARE
eukprot:jgi/Mesen1/5758/ME000292S04841